MRIILKQLITRKSVFFQPDEDAINLNERYLKNEFQIMFHELDQPILDNEILKACKELKNDKAGGPDLFINEFYKYGIDYFLHYFRTLFNKLLSSGYFPSCWSEGFIIPLFKKGDKNLPENYRGITLLSTLGKLFTRILNNRLSNWAEKYQVFVESQAGFRAKMGTIDNIFILHGLIDHILNENKRIYTCFIDFTKAFDLLVRENIWVKLIKIGVRGNILNVLRSMYENVKSRVKINNTLSDTFICSLGVRQGDCLSPFLFSIYVNDLEETFIREGFKGISIGMFKLFLLLYADDIVVMAESISDLQNAMNILKDYCDKWKLTVNVNKTKAMVFRKGGRLGRNTKLSFNGTEIEFVNKFTYLGIVFTPRGSFEQTFEALSGQALKAIFKMKSYRTFRDS